MALADAVDEHQEPESKIWGNETLPDLETWIQEPKKRAAQRLRDQGFDEVNQGCLKPIESQRVTDVILKCFQACAASQGDTNAVEAELAQHGEAPQGFIRTLPIPDSLTLKDLSGVTQ
ncbi:uncharacterized protein N7511_002822 [Penicillium nucicola]|uniref:uncharacterized protein n=1 Tax=Penicillium nucicola TaxID=1850975 RepID=UPI0025456F45|nr:uncharacterized protein N7511_002822 [Penicillium nucicola]KAJ5770771.1 hypothetical protein N7511_002822 [Penicillium nucicola]